MYYAKSSMFANTKIARAIQERIKEPIKQSCFITVLGHGTNNCTPGMLHDCN